MLGLRTFDGIDRASLLLADPLVVSELLMKVKVERVLRRTTLREALEDLVRASEELARQGRCAYFTAKTKAGPILRGIVAGGQVVSIALEAEGVMRAGAEALRELDRLWSDEVMASHGSIAIDELPAQLREVVREALRSKEPPGAWLGKVLYGTYSIESLLTEKGGYAFVLIANDGRARFVVKVPKKNVVNDKRALDDYVRSSLSPMFVARATEADLLPGLRTLGINEGIARSLAKYSKYVSAPVMVSLPVNRFDDLAYVERPPVIVEPYADRGDLASMVSRASLDLDNLIYIGIRISGALALAHVLGVLHMDVKPSNILLASDPSEVLGYRPVLTDFAGGPSLGARARISKVTPEYADPLSLLEGYAGPDYDVYSLGMTLARAAVPRIFEHRVLANLVIMATLYGHEARVEQYARGNAKLSRLAERLKALFREFASRRITLDEVAGSMASELGELDEEDYKVLEESVGKEVSSLIRSSTLLDRKRRLSNAVLQWNSFVETARRLGRARLVVE